MKPLVWKFYFWVILAFDMVSFVIPYERRIWEVAETGFFIVALCGLFGFCWERKIIAKLFWQLFFAAFLCWLLVYFTLGRSQATKISLSAVPLPTLVILGVVVVALHVPLFWGLFLYAFKSEVWEEK